MMISEGDVLWMVWRHSQMVSKTDFSARVLYKDTSIENTTLADTGHLMKNISSFGILVLRKRALVGHVFNIV